MTARPADLASNNASPLHDIDEKQGLRRIRAGDLATSADECFAVFREERLISQREIQAQLVGHVAGVECPPFTTGEGGGVEGETLVARVRDVYALPRSGVVIRPGGGVFALTAVEARHKYPNLVGLPHIRQTGQAPAFAPPARCETIADARVWMAFGGGFNYGHFLLDCLSGLLAMEEAGIEAPALCPPLSRWQRDLLDLAFPGVPLHITPAPIVKLGAAAFASPMHVFLHRPNELVVRLRDRILRHAPQGQGARRVYLSRRGLTQRYMIGEAELESCLVANGFVVARPEKMDVAAQIALMRDAEVVVAPAGAALANALFLKPGAKVFEILPANFASQWVRALCAVTGVEWFGYFCESPAPRAAVPLPIRLRWAPRALAGAYHFAYAPPLADFLALLKANL